MVPVLLQRGKLKDEIIGTQRNPDCGAKLVTLSEVFNVTKDDIRVRMAVIDEDVWPLPSITETLPADPKDRVGFSDFIVSGRVPFQDDVDRVYKEVNEAFGTNVPAPQ